MVTGGKGIHVIAPLQPVTEWPFVKLFCRTFAQKLEDNEPDQLHRQHPQGRAQGPHVRRLPAQRARLDGHCAILDARPQGVPCAVPVGWDELDTFKAANAFSLETAAAKAQEPDPWPDYFKLTQSITKGMVEAVAGPLKDLKLWLHPARQFLADHGFQHIHAALGIVEARDVGIVLAAGVLELLARR